MSPSSLPDLLLQRASERPDDTAYTFVDFEIDPEGFAESITFSEAHRRALGVAEELRLCGSVGDRAAILAPQGLEYITAFMGALQAGFIAVPLPVPQFGIFDERVSAALRDCSPSVILTTSSSVDEVLKYRRPQNGCAETAVIEIDSLDLDSPREFDSVRVSPPTTAYLQYTSGSTRSPAGVEVSHQNVLTNVRQAFSAYFEDYGGSCPPDVTFISWLPFFHDMGLISAVFTPLFDGNPALLTSPAAFLQRPARWMQLLGRNGSSLSCAPNFAFDLAARRTSDADMAGLDLSNVKALVSGSERVHPATIKRFNERFEPWHLKPTAIRPSYGLAEATLYVATPPVTQTGTTVRFDSKHLAKGEATPCSSDVTGGIDLVTYGVPEVCIVRIVDPESSTENPPGTIGEIWVHGENVAMGYWKKPQVTERTFAAELVEPSAGTPKGPWLRTGDLGVMVNEELFIIGRLKDLLIVDGRNHYPDDIEATIQQVIAGRVAAIAVPNDRTEQLVAIVEIKRADDAQKLRTVKREIISAVGDVHNLRVADLVLVPPGSIPITTSGKTRRSACVERYRRDEFQRLDVSAGLLNEVG
jgi:long chain fatty acid CoA FadD26